MAEKIVLDAQPRSITGKQVSQLRRQELVPAVIYGPRLAQAINIQAPRKALQESLRQAGGTHLIEINVGGEKHSALVRDVQRDVLKGHLLHVDFYAVALDTKLRVEVPLAVVGESPVVRSGEALLVSLATSVEVECLPQHIPTELTVDASRIVAVGDELTVGDLAVPPNVTVMADPEEVLIRAVYAAAPETTEEEVTEAGAEAVEVIKRGKAEEEEF